MSVERFKRFRMQLDLQKADLPPAELPDGYRWLSWRPLLNDRHARVKWKSFRGDLDGRVFSCLSQLAGCRRLMNEISRQPGFCPDATWLLAFQPEPSWPADDCGTIQGIIRRGDVGAIQNIGVAPTHRGQGLGRALVLKALHGFRYHGLNTAELEVTALNRVAVRLYRNLGFEVTRVLYRDAEAGRIIDGSERAPASQDASRPAPSSLT